MNEVVINLPMFGDGVTKGLVAVLMMAFAFSIVSKLVSPARIFKTLLGWVGINP